MLVDLTDHSTAANTSATGTPNNSNNNSTPPIENEGTLVSKAYTSKPPLNVAQIQLILGSRDKELVSHFTSLQSNLISTQKQLEEAKAHYKLLQDDFLFNLKLLDERDRDLNYMEKALDESSNRLEEANQEGLKSKSTISHLTALLQDAKIEYQSDLASLQQSHEVELQDLEKRAHIKYEAQQSQLAEAALCIQQLKHDNAISETIHKNRFLEAERSHESAIALYEQKAKQASLTHDHQIQLLESNSLRLAQEKSSLIREFNEFKENHGQVQLELAALQAELNMSRKRELLLKDELAQVLTDSEQSQMKLNSDWELKYATLEKENQLIEEAAGKYKDENGLTVSNLRSNNSRLESSYRDCQKRLDEKEFNFQILEQEFKELEAVHLQTLRGAEKICSNLSQEIKTLTDKLARAEEQLDSFKEENRLLVIHEAEQDHALDKQKAAFEGLSHRLKLAQNSMASTSEENSTLKMKMEEVIYQNSELSNIISQMRIDMENLHAQTLSSTFHQHDPNSSRPMSVNGLIIPHANDKTILGLYKHIEKLQKLLLKTSEQQKPPPLAPDHDVSNTAAVSDPRLPQATAEVRRLNRECTRLLDLNNSLSCQLREMRSRALRPSTAHSATQCELLASGSKRPSLIPLKSIKNAIPKPSNPILSGVKGASIRNWNVRDDQ